MIQEILDSPIREEKTFLRTKQIKHLEIGLFVFSGIVFFGGIYSWIWGKEDAAPMLFVILIYGVPAIYGIWFRKKSIEFDENISLKTFQVPFLAEACAYISFFTGLISIVLCIVLAVMLFTDESASSLQYGLLLGFILMAGIMGFIYLRYPNITMKRIKEVNKLLGEN